jgi:hypothetical protein
MTKTKYFVIRYDIAEANIRHVADTLNDARVEAERRAIAYPGARFLIASETQSVVVQTQVKWTDK